MIMLKSTLVVSTQRRRRDSYRQLVICITVVSLALLFCFNSGSKNLGSVVVSALHVASGLSVAHGCCRGTKITAFSSSLRQPVETMTSSRNRNTNAFFSRQHQNRCSKPVHKIITSTRSISTSLNFMGSDGGILGIGGPEVATILLVGYFVLGPSDLYKLVKEIGKFIQNARTLSTDLTKTFESNMNDVVQIEELRKAQRELNDAFSFRRTINVDAESEAFAFAAGSAQQNYNSATTVGSTDAVGAVLPAGSETKPKKKLRRRVLKRPESTIASEMTTVPEYLDMPTPFTPITADPLTTQSEWEASDNSSMTPEEIAEIENEFDKYTAIPTVTSESKQNDIKERNGELQVAVPTTATIPVQPKTLQEVKVEQSRFQQQLSGNWNQQVLTNQDKLEPMAIVMNKIALLEQERQAALRRIEEEYQKRQQLEEEFYSAQRKLLDQAAIQVQEQAFGLTSTVPTTTTVVEPLAMPTKTTTTAS